MTSKCRSRSSSGFGTRSVSRKYSSNNVTADGDKAADFATNQMAAPAQKKRQTQFDAMMLATKLNCGEFLKNFDKNRAPVPINDKKRVKVQCTKPNDSDYVPASYASYEREDYIFMQGPKDKQAAVDYWRVVWQDSCKILVSVTPLVDLNEKEEERSCFPYWPREEGKSITLGDGRFTIKLSKRNECKGFVCYELRLKSTEEDGGGGGKGTKDNEEADASATSASEEKERHLTLIHFENWPHDKWPDIDHVANFVQTLSKKEIQAIRKAIDNYVPPVLLQGHEAIGRTCIVWVATILFKDMEKKESFDVDDFIKKLAKQRPGALHSRLHFTVTFCTAYRLAAMSGWIGTEDARNKIKEMKTAMERLSSGDKTK